MEEHRGGELQDKHTGWSQEGLGERSPLWPEQSG